MNRIVTWVVFFTGLFLASTVFAIEGEKAVDKLTDNLFRDCPLKIVPAGPKDADQTPKVRLISPDYWKMDLDSGKKKLEEYDIALDKEVKCAGDCSVRLEGTTG